MKISKYFLLLLPIIVSFNLSAQQIGNVELKKPGRPSGDMAAKKIKDAPKKIFIAEFNIMYQLVFTDKEETREGVNHGKTKAELTVAAANLHKEDLTYLTDKIYKSYLDNLASKGYEILDAAQAADAKPYTDWQLMKGGGLNEAQLRGYILSTPTNYSYYVKKVSKKGKEKTGMINNSIKISQAIGGAVVAKVNILIPFIVDAESGLSKSTAKIVGGVSKIVVKPSLHIAAGGVMTGHNTIYQTGASYAYSTGMKVQAMAKTNLKEDVEIPSVFEDKKFKAVAVTQLNTEYDAGAYTIVHSIDVTQANVQEAKCDVPKYKSGVQKASIKFLNASLNRFYGFTEGN